MNKTTLCFLAAASLLSATGILLHAADLHKLKPVSYASDGTVPVPDYRRWVFLGSGLGMTYTGENHENPPFTNVFAEPAAYDQFMKDGVWPDRTVLIAEHRASATNLSINKGGWAQTGDAIGPEIEIKDQSKGGWKFYAVARGEKTGKVLASTAACYSCHADHAAVDNTFVQFYPSLIEVARGKGTWRQ